MTHHGGDVRGRVAAIYRVFVLPHGDGGHAEVGDQLQRGADARGEMSSGRCSRYSAFYFFVWIAPSLVEPIAAAHD